MDIGDSLRRARMQKRLTLQDLARSTKISPGTLEALENNDFSRLPAAVYIRSFLRQYAREVNLDPSETVRSYMQQIEAAAPPPPPPVAPPPVRPVHIATDADRRRTIVIDPQRLPVPAMTAAALVLAALFYFSWTSRGDEAGEEVGVAQAAAPDLAPTAPPAVAEPDATRAANVVPDVLRVELTITGPSWVSATADRAPALAKLLRAGDDQVLEARDELILRLGEPSTVSVTINGQQARPLGRRGQPTTVTITRQNYRALLAP